MQDSGRVSLERSEKSAEEATGPVHGSNPKDIALPNCDNELPNDIDEKRLIRRIDFTLIPWLSFLVLLCFLDRMAIGNARLYGMEEDLNMSDNQYLLCLTIFFIPFSLLEVPANILLRRLRPSIWLSSCILMWGIVTIVQGFVKSFSGLLAVRVLLGTFEASFIPGTSYYLSCWYRRDELGVRLAIFTVSGTFSGAIGGLLAAAISNMGGVGGKPAWAWIFIMEGIITVLAGLASYFLIQDFPDSARFLSKPERQFIIRRLVTDDQFSAAGEQLLWRNVRKSMCDWKTWLGSVVIIGSRAPIFAFAFFLPSLISMLGYTATRANLLVVPVYTVASLCPCIIGHVADRVRKRGYFSIGLHTITATAFVALLCSRNKALSYFAIYVAASSAASASPNTLAWIANNIEGTYKRSVSVAIVVTIGFLTGIISTNTYRSGDRPWYSKGHAITLSIVVAADIAAVILHILLRNENKRRDRGERDEVIGDSKSGDPRNGCYDSVEAAKRDKGDEWSGYRYVI